MKIIKVELENIRCFKEIKIDFTNISDSIIFAGDNGSGKTVLLRSIAMGLCDESSAAALLRDLPGKFVRKGGGETGYIRIYLQESKNKCYQIITTITALKAFENLINSKFTQHHVVLTNLYGTISCV